MNGPARPMLHLDAIVRALAGDDEVRERLIDAYGLSTELTEAEFIDALLTEFDQAPVDNPYAEMRRPEQVYRAAVRAIGSNSRSWLTFAEREPELAELLCGYDPGAVHERTDDGELSADDVAEFFPGITRSQDAAAVLAWAARLAERDFGVETRAVATALVRLHEEEHGTPLEDGHRMPVIVLLLSNPERRWDGWELLPDSISKLSPDDLKLPGMGPALGSELFRNLGWSGFKPDRHIMRLLDLWVPDVVKAQSTPARHLAALTNRSDRVATEFLQYSLAGQAVTPPDTSYSMADNLMWALGAYVEKKGRESNQSYVIA